MILKDIGTRFEYRIILPVSRHVWQSHILNSILLLQNERNANSGRNDTVPGDRSISIIDHQNPIHLHQRAARQRGHTHCGTRRIRLAEIVGHDLVHFREMAEVGEINI
jgi:hypothetical protein